MVDFVLGDNPFFGVNHSNYASELASESILDVYKCASNNCKSFMLSPHPGYDSLLSQITEGFDSNQLLPISLVFPYPHTINDLLASDGILEIIKRTNKMNLIAATIKNIFPVIFSGKISSFKNVWGTVLGFELDKISKTSHTVEDICLHNVLNDIFIATDNASAIAGFIECCNDLGYNPVLLTQNIIDTSEFLLRHQLQAVVCGSYNNNGYMVNPKKNEVVDYFLNSSTQEYWLMQIFSSGRSNINEVIESLKNIENKYSRLVIASRKSERLLKTIEELKKI